MAAAAAVVSVFPEWQLLPEVRTVLAALHLTPHRKKNALIAALAPSTVEHSDPVAWPLFGSSFGVELIPQLKELKHGASEWAGR